MATKVSQGKILLAVFDGPTVKTPL